LHSSARPSGGSSPRSPSAPRRMKLQELLPRWKEALRTWRAWMCTQTKQTLQQLMQGVPESQLGGMSNAMAIRSPAAYAYYDNEDDVVHATRISMFTHRETTAQQGGEFFARVTYRVIHKGLTPRQAIEQVAQSSPKFIQQKVKQAVEKVAEATDPAQPLSKEEFVDDLALTSMARLWDVGRSEPIKVGKASPTEGTLPGSIYFILKYEGDFAGAVKANAMVGGDSASRAIAIGMVMGAAEGVDAIPAELGPGKLQAWERGAALLQTMPLAKRLREQSQVKDEL